MSNLSADARLQVVLDIVKKILASEVFLVSVEKRYQILKDWGLSKGFINNVNVQGAASSAASNVATIAYDTYREEMHLILGALNQLTPKE